jgi:hypothetical protein
VKQSPVKKSALANTRKNPKRNESPRKGEVALLQETCKLSPINPSRKAAEKAKKALITSKASVKSIDIKNQGMISKLAGK